MYYVMITFCHCTMYFAGENNDAIKLYIMYMYFELHFSSFFFQITCTGIMIFLIILIIQSNYCKNICIYKGKKFKTPGACVWNALTPASLFTGAFCTKYKTLH